MIRNETVSPVESANLMRETGVIHCFKTVEDQFKAKVLISDIQKFVNSSSYNRIYTVSSELIQGGDIAIGSVNFRIFETLNVPWGGFSYECQFSHKSHDQE